VLNEIKYIIYTIKEIDAACAEREEVLKKIIWNRCCDHLLPRLLVRYFATCFFF